MLTLAFETAFSELSVAIFRDKKLLSFSSFPLQSKQSEFLIPELENVLQANQIWYNDLDLIACNKGPGSLTGTRVGMVSAKTIKLATNSDLILVDSCEAITNQYSDLEEEIFVVIDGSMNEFFCAKFLAKNQMLETILKPTLASLEDVINLAPRKKFLLCGSGKNQIKESLKNSNFVISQNPDIVNAKLVGELAIKKFLSKEKSEDFNPLYLRKPKIEIRKK